MLPRCVLVERPSEYTELLVRHATHEQVRFFLESRGRSLAEVRRRHEAGETVRRTVLGSIPVEWRRAVVAREEIDRFLFEPDDVVVVLGQDGLVANVAKYLEGQPVIGLNPDPERFPGVLVAHPPVAAGDLLRDVALGRARLEARTMVEARLDDGQVLHALNEVLVGHVSHQSARYTITADGRSEHQSSSGVLVTTGTGATGWAASIVRERAERIALPAPGDDAVAFLVREAWPSAATGTTLTGGLVAAPERVALRSELAEGGVVFGDGIEADRLELDWGQEVSVGVADRRLMLVA